MSTVERHELRTLLRGVFDRPGVQALAGRTITEADCTWFALLTMNQHPLHSDAHYAETYTSTSSGWSWGRWSIAS